MYYNYHYVFFKKKEKEERWYLSCGLVEFNWPSNVGNKFVGLRTKFGSLTITCKSFDCSNQFIKEVGRKTHFNNPKQSKYPTMMPLKWPTNDTPGNKSWIKINKHQGYKADGTLKINTFLFSELESWVSITIIPKIIPTFFYFLFFS